MDMNIVDFFEKGGPVMYVLALLSCYLMAIIMLKTVQFMRYGKISANMINVILNETKQNPNNALQMLKNSNGAISRMMEFVLSYIIKNPMLTKKQQDMIESEGNSIVKYFESHMKGLEMIANIAPLMGLLGTVTGMVSAFAALASNSAKIDPALLAGGIWEALITTVAGLILAIPAMAFHYYCESRIEKIRFTLSIVVTKLLSDDFSYSTGVNYRRNLNKISSSKKDQSEFQFSE